MGFKAMYTGLMDIFPQVDTRILRAVAIENPKDADKAVEVVLREIIPNIASTSGSANDSVDNASCEEDSVHSVFNVPSSHVVYDDDHVRSPDVKQVALPEKLSIATKPSQSRNVLSTISDSGNVSSNLDCLVESHLEQPFSNITSLDAYNMLSPTAFHDCPPLASENVLQHTSEVVGGNEKFEAGPENTITISEVVEFEPDHVEDKSTHGVVDIEHVGAENISTCVVDDTGDEYALNTQVSRSGEICRIDLLEDIVNEARDNKKTLFTAMNSVISLMKEVEVKERAAEQLKEEAAKGPVGIIASVDELKQMLCHAREANDMHAGEVNGEKAILATEAKELQSRLFCLSDERDNSLDILDEMRQTLEQRLDAAEKAMKEAEEEKIEKEELARKALAEQQLIMEKLVAESKMLNQAAEENSKLQEFLMDRGRVVDTLQGEISVICQDIKLLKKKFDQRLPLSESISSSQTSCRLASLSSSARSFPPDQVPMPIEIAIQTSKTNSTSPISNHLSSEEELEANDRDAQVEDDGWEVFDKKDFHGSQLLPSV